MDNFSISNQCRVPEPFYPKSSVDDDSLDSLGCLDVKSFDLYHRFRGLVLPTIDCGLDECQNYVRSLRTCAGNILALEHNRETQVGMAIHTAVTSIEHLHLHRAYCHWFLKTWE